MQALRCPKTLINSGVFAQLPEVWAWSGHLTLARARRPLAAASVPAGEVAWEWTVERIALVASTLDPAGARYCDLAVYHLGG